MIDNTCKCKPIKLELPNNPELLERWCLTILESLERFWAEDLPMWREIVLKTCDVNWKRKYRLQARKELLHDINEWAMESMNQQALQMLNRELRQEFGFDLNDFSNQNNRHIQNILRRGVIRNEEEYRLVSNKVEEIYADNSQEQLACKLNDLLGAFDN
ncbi:MAG: hypothetical protein J5867_09760 [Prevotella sp.]|nr:hypothetical protein [Prevotella sp.]